MRVDEEKRAIQCTMIQDFIKVSRIFQNILKYVECSGTFQKFLRKEYIRSGRRTSGKLSKSEI